MLALTPKAEAFYRELQQRRLNTLQHVRKLVALSETYGTDTWADIDLDGGTLATRPQWEGNKNGREETLPLSPGLHEALKDWREKHPGPETARVVTVTSRTLRYFDDDLVAAGLARRIPLDGADEPIPLDEKDRPVRKPVKWFLAKRGAAAGRVLDLHALRHTFGTRLGRMPGIDPKSVQALMRHADPRLTFGVYVHSDKARLKAAVAALPQINTEHDEPASGNAAAAS